jgi:hypothetical protein
VRADPWPEHWLTREVAGTATVVAIGQQSYHQIVVGMEDDRSRKLLGEKGYRLCRIEAEPRDPRLNRRGVYRRRLPDNEEDHAE